jgi:hypothetical protein
MKQLILYAVLFLLIIGCKKSSAPDSAASSQNGSVTGNSDTISHAETGGWSFQMNGAGPVYGTTTECLMSQVVAGGAYQLVMSGILSPYSVAVQIGMPSTVPVVGQYTASLTNNTIQVNYMYAEGSYTFYSSDSITFNVVSYDQTTRAVSATFYGNVNDGFGNISTITNGTITGIVQQ